MTDARGLRPLAIDLFCGLGGWSEGLLAEQYDVIGFDLEAHRFGEIPPGLGVCHRCDNPPCDWCRGRP